MMCRAYLDFLWIKVFTVEQFQGIQHCCCLSGSGSGLQSRAGHLAQPDTGWLPCDEH